MTCKEVAEYVGRSIKTVEHWATEGRGPPFSRRGGVRYYKDEVDAWLEGNRFKESKRRAPNRPAKL
jgi:excisionase family DNA binding protein